MSLYTFYSFKIVNKKLSKTFLLLLFGSVFFTTSCNNPLGKGEKIVDFEYDRFKETYFDRLLERVEDDKKDHTANFLLSRHYYTNAEIPQAWYHINEALNIEELPAYILLKAKILLARRQFKDAKKLALELEQSDYKHLDTYKILTEVYLNQKETDSALHYISFIKRIDKTIKEIPYYSAINYQNAYDTSDAIREYYNTLIAWPNNLTAYNNLSELLLAKKDFKNAHEVTKAGLKHFPNNSELLFAEATYIEEQGFEDSAVVIYKKAYSISSSNAKLGYRIGKYHLKKHQTDSALHYFERSLDHPENNVHQDIADIYFSKYKNDLALKYYEQAFIKDSNSAYLKQQISRSKWRINYINNPNLSTQNVSQTDSSSNSTQTRDTIQ